MQHYEFSHSFKPPQKGWQKMESKIHDWEAEERALKQFWQVTSSTLITICFILFLNNNQQMSLSSSPDIKLGEMKMAEGKIIEKKQMREKVHYYIVQMQPVAREEDSL